MDIAFLNCYTLIKLAKVSSGNFCLERRASEKLLNKNNKKKKKTFPKLLLALGEIISYRRDLENLTPSMLTLPL